MFIRFILFKRYNLDKRGNFIASPIARTPIFEGEVAKDFFKELKRPNSPKENFIKERIANSRYVKFL